MIQIMYQVVQKKGTQIPYYDLKTLISAIAWASIPPKLHRHCTRTPSYVENNFYSDMLGKVKYSITLTKGC